MLKRLLFGGKSRLRAYETVCLRAWVGALPPPAREILGRQLERFDMVQRLSADKLVTFHDLRDRTYRSWPDEALFPLRDEERLAGTVSLRPAGGGRKVRADVVLHRGRLSSLEFDRPPGPLFSGDEQAFRQVVADPGYLGIEVIDVSVGADVLAPAPRPTAPGAPPTLDPGWFGEQAGRGGAEALRPPLSAAERDAILRQVDATLPADYLELVARAEGARVGGAVVYGLSQLRRIVLPERNFYVLAEVEGRGELGVPQGDRAGEVYLMGEDDPEPAGPSLRAALELYA